VDATTGTAYIPAATDVRHGTNVDATTGTAYIPAATDVRHGTNVDATTGVLYVPSPTDVLTGIQTDATTGSLTLPSAAQVLVGVQYGVGGSGSTGTYYPPNTDGAGTPDASAVVPAAHFGAANATQGTAAGALESTVTELASAVAALPTAGQVAAAVLQADLSTVEAAAATDSLCTVCLATLHSSVAGTTWTIRKTDGTTMATKTVTPSADAEPIVGVG
jgi:hypothetical protein